MGASESCPLHHDEYNARLPRSSPREQLVEGGCDEGEAAGVGRALFDAARNGQSQVVEELIKGGCDTDKPVNDGERA